MALQLFDCFQEWTFPRKDVDPLSHAHYTVGFLVYFSTSPSITYYSQYCLSAGNNWGEEILQDGKKASSGCKAPIHPQFECVIQGSIFLFLQWKGSESVWCLESRISLVLLRGQYYQHKYFEKSFLLWKSLPNGVNLWKQIANVFRGCSSLCFVGVFWDRPAPGEKDNLLVMHFCCTYEFLLQGRGVGSGERICHIRCHGKVYQIR